MALPRLNNETPHYELTIPSTGKKVKYRPFLVKEQKNLLVALESQDPKNILMAVVDCISSCTEDVDTNKLSTFDTDYMFVKIRSKSVGEKSTVNAACDKCEHQNPVDVNLDNIKMDNVDTNTTINLSSDISVQLKYPTYIDMTNNERLFSEQQTATGMLFDTIAMCIESVNTNEERIALKDEPVEEVEAFINSLNGEQLQKITNFVEAMPSLTHKIEYTCESCGHKNEKVLSGIQDFF